MTLPNPRNKTQATLLQLIKNRQMNSAELSRATNVGYPPRKVQVLQETHGIDIFHSRQDYKTVEGKVTKVALYTLLTPIQRAKEIYLGMVKS